MCSNWIKFYSQLEKKNIQHEMMTAPIFTTTLLVWYEKKQKNQNTSNTYLMGHNASKKCGVTDHALQVYGYSPSTMLNMLKKNLFSSKGGI